MHERNQLRKDDEIDKLTKQVEKQIERNQTQRTMIEWKLKRVEDSKEVISNFSKMHVTLNSTCLQYRLFVLGIY